MKTLLALLLFSATALPAAAQSKKTMNLENLLRTHASPQLQAILDQPQVYQYQILYTQIDRDRRNRPRFTTHAFNVDRDRYFYPASTVKLATALLALEKLNELQPPGVDKYTPMLTDSARSSQTAVLEDTTAQGGFPSIAHYIKKMLVVSDNDAYNRLYEWVGHQALNEKLWAKGYQDLRISRRFVRVSEEENRHTNPIRFEKDGQVLYVQPAAYNPLPMPATHSFKVGKGYINQEKVLENEPMDFSTHNRFPLEDQQLMLRSVLFPESVPASRRFNLTPDDYALLRRHLGMLPSESDFPRYDPEAFYDSYTKFFWFKANKGQVPKNIRSYNKPGWSYGFLTDNAYIVDQDANVEFLLSAVIYANHNDILNDDTYNYDLGYAFFKEVGEIVYRHEWERRRR